MGDEETSRAVPIEGSVAPGWEPVQQAFEANFTLRDDLSAAVAV